MGIHTQHEAVVFMRTDCHVCRSEGLSANSRVLLAANGREVIATLYQVSSDMLEIDEAGLSETAWDHLQAADGAAMFVRHPDPVESFGRVRARIFGSRLGDGDFTAILKDISADR